MELLLTGEPGVLVDCDNLGFFLLLVPLLTPLLVLSPLSSLVIDDCGDDDPTTVVMAAIPVVRRVGTILLVASGTEVLSALAMAAYNTIYSTLSISSTEMTELIEIFCDQLAKPLIDAS